MKRLWMVLVLGLASTAMAEGITLNGSGASFPGPLYSKWFTDYTKLHPEVKFNYQQVGSGEGVKQITAKAVDFAGSDLPMTEAELGKAAGVVHIPTAMGAVVLAYNLPGLNHLSLSPATIAGIFLGTISRWSDPAIVAENPTSKLPDSPILVAHRSDPSGTTGIFLDYLAKVSPEGKAKLVGPNPAWPVGTSAKGNAGVAGLITKTVGTIGYVELAFANQNHLLMASVKNKAGKFVRPTLKAVSAAAAGVTMPEDFRVSITNPEGPESYPISSFTYLLVYRDQSEASKAALIKFLWWALHDGQEVEEDLDYAILPAPVLSKVDLVLKKLTVQGKTVLAAQ